MESKEKKRNVKSRKFNTFYYKESRAMVRNIHKFLKEEYEFTMLHRDPDCDCDFKHLRNISRRTAQAIGVCERTVHRIIGEEREQVKRNRGRASGARSSTITSELQFRTSEGCSSASMPAQIDPVRPAGGDSGTSVDSSTIFSTNNAGIVIATTTINQQKSNMLFMEINENGELSKTFLQ